jgi:hypothetical protein
MAKAGKALYFWRTTRTDDRFEWADTGKFRRGPNHPARYLPIGEAERLIQRAKIRPNRHSAGESYLAALGPNEAGYLVFNSTSEYLNLLGILKVGARRLGLEVGTHLHERKLYFCRKTRTSEVFSWPPEQNSPAVGKHAVTKLPLAAALDVVGLPTAETRTKDIRDRIARLKPGVVGLAKVNSWKDRARIRAGLHVRFDKVLYWRPDQTDFDGSDLKTWW